MNLQKVRSVLQNETCRCAAIDAIGFTANGNGFARENEKKGSQNENDKLYAQLFTLRR